MLYLLLAAALAARVGAELSTQFGYAADSISYSQYGQVCKINGL